MNKICFILIALVMCSAAKADKFTGKWAVTEVVFPKNYFGEIMNPKYFELVKRGNKIQGKYRDQYDFPFSELVSGDYERHALSVSSTLSRRKLTVFTLGTSPKNRYRTMAELLSFEK